MGHDEDSRRGRLLRDESVEFLLVPVPLDGVKGHGLQVVIARQRDRIAKPHRLGDVHVHVPQPLNTCEEEEKRLGKMWLMCFDSFNGGNRRGKRHWWFLMGGWLSTKGVMLVFYWNARSLRTEKDRLVKLRGNVKIYTGRSRWYRRYPIYEWVYGVL